jgi:hypothetical protein
LKTIAAVGALLLVSTSASADGLSDLRASLARLTARDAVRGTITIETNSSGDDDDQPDIGKATFEAEHGPQGLRVAYSSALILRAQQEARESDADPQRPTPARTGMRRVDPAELMESLDSASMIAGLLESATLVREQRVNIGGRPLRQLTMNLKPKLSKADAKRIKTLEVTLVVNVDDDAVPVSADLHRKIKAKFLLMTFENVSHGAWSFARVGDRLVAVRHVEKSSGSGMGQNFENTKTLTVTPKNGEV